MLFVCILLTLCGSIYCCSDLKPVPNFDFSELVHGKWYEIARYNTFDLEKNADCITYTYEPHETGTVDLREVYKNKVTTIKAQTIPTAENGKLTFHIKESATPYVNVTVVAATKDYVMFFNCAEGYAWIVSRSPRIEPELKAEIHKYIDETHDLDPSKIVWDDITSKECFDLI